MKLRSRGLAAALVVFAAAVPAYAVVSFSTRDGSLNPAGQSVSAKLDVIIQGDRLIVRLSNTTTDLAAFEQTLNSLCFSIAKKDANGSLGKTNGQKATFSTAGVQINTELSETQWTLTTTGNRFMLHAPGNQHTILPDLHNGGLDKANKSVTAPGAHEYLTGPVVFEILVPGIDLTDEITGVRFGWASTQELDQKISEGTSNMDTPGIDNSQFSLPGDLLMGPVSQTSEELLSDPVRSYADSVGASGAIDHGVGSGGAISSPSGQNANNNNGGVQPDFQFGSSGGGDGSGGGTINPPELFSAWSTSPLVPEPMTLGLLSLGMLGLLAKRRRPIN
ncbi:MAG: PEP-CTERM sorting domain-containing protein [Phycisphaerae bacterium]